MLFWIGLGILLIGGIVARVASKRGEEGESLKKVGECSPYLAGRSGR